MFPQNISDSKQNMCMCNKIIEAYLKKLHKSIGGNLSFFAHNDWEFKDISGENTSVEENESNEGDFFIAHDENSEECPNCLCRPCIKNERNRQLWWENENHPEHERNAYLRKDKYKRFWTNLLHRGVWKDPRYLLQKRDALRRDPRRHKCVYHRRDLMPKCVLELLEIKQKYQKRQIDNQKNNAVSSPVLKDTQLKHIKDTMRKEGDDLNELMRRVNQMKMESGV
ncbi:unnamed protein product [Mytilus coruscus]|uniref:Uncharacterized protein n=1 Tax=Mytilus coruscus TaxID=42192 RepID=A0A6J8BKJ0_MYTCO|nr:unnamed protein product [Mytilus coruscus]